LVPVGNGKDKCSILFYSMLQILLLNHHGKREVLSHATFKYQQTAAAGQSCHWYHTTSGLAHIHWSDALPAGYFVWCVL